MIKNILQPFSFSLPRSLEPWRKSPHTMLRCPLLPRATRALAPMRTATTIVARPPAPHLVCQCHTMLVPLQPQAALEPRSHWRLCTTGAARTLPLRSCRVTLWPHVSSTTVLGSRLALRDENWEKSIYNWRRETGAWRRWMLCVWRRWMLCVLTTIIGSLLCIWRRETGAWTY
jgi:hypothetical protein